MLRICEASYVSKLCLSYAIYSLYIMESEGGTKDMGEKPHTPGFEHWGDHHAAINPFVSVARMDEELAIKEKLTPGNHNLALCYAAADGRSAVRWPGGGRGGA